MSAYATARRTASRWRIVGWRVLAGAALVTLVVAVAKRQDPQGATDLTVSEAVTTVSTAVTTPPHDNVDVTSTTPSSTAALAVPRPRSAIEPRLSTAPNAPYRAGQIVTFRVPLSIVEDYSNDMPLICFDWGEHEACDPAAWGRLQGGRRDSDDAVWVGSLPGWVTAPTGLRSCEELGCRLTIIDNAHRRISTAVLSIDPGPAPKPLADISIRSDGSIELHSTGIAADASWTAWARATAPTGRCFPAQATPAARSHSTP